MNPIVTNRCKNNKKNNNKRLIDFLFNSKTENKLKILKIK